jgi:hypothetical protein
MLCTGAKTWDPNFENILHILDRVGSYLGSDETTSNTHIDELLIDLGRCHWIPRQPREDWSRVPALAREVLATAIRELWERCDRKSAARAYQRFFSGLTKSANVSIYSLNYDPLLLESIGDLPHFCTGFTQGGDFDPEGVQFFATPNTLGFLHGHVGFFRYSGVTRLINNYAKAQQNRLNDSMIDIGPKGRHYNTYLITGLDKMEGFNHDPFGVYLHRLALDLRASSEIIIIGYSLADEHLNAFLANAIRLGVQRVTYVTRREPYTLIGAFDPMSYDNLLRLASLFSDTVRDIPDCRLAKEAVASCQDTGYGYLTDHVQVYVRGTEEFIKQESPNSPT